MAGIIINEHAPLKFGPSLYEVNKHNAVPVEEHEGGVTENVTA